MTTMRASRRSSWRSYEPPAPATGPAAKASAAPRSTSAAAVPATRVRVLGLDPGSRITGFGVVDCDGVLTRYVASGAIRTASGEFAGRLQEIYAGVAALVALHRPDEIAIERVFVHANPDSALKLGQARGAALSATFDASRPTGEYSPREVKLAVTGSGAADKTQVARMVKTLLGLQGRLQADAGDALAIALCHAQGRQMRLAIRRGRGR